MDRVLKTLVGMLEDRFTNAFDPASKKMLQILNITMHEVTNDRDLKLALLSDLYGRQLESTKDLTIAEAMAFNRMAKNAPNFLTYLKERANERQPEL
jgi:hypothetical protein